MSAKKTINGAERMCEEVGERAGRREGWEGVGGAKGAAWCGRAAPKEIPLEGIMILESDSIAPVGSFRSFANALFRGICGIDSLLQRSKGASRYFLLVDFACCWILVSKFEVDAGWK